MRLLLSPLPSKPRSQKDTLETRLLPSILKAKAATSLMGRRDLWSGHIYFNYTSSRTLLLKKVKFREKGVRVQLHVRFIYIPI